MWWGRLPGDGIAGQWYARPIESLDRILARVVGSSKADDLQGRRAERLLVEGVTPALERFVDVEIVVRVGLIVTLYRQERLWSEYRSVATNPHPHDAASGTPLA